MCLRPAQILTALFFASVLFSCAPPSGLKGVWKAAREECTLKDKDGFFKSSFTDKNKYTLEFAGTGDVVRLTYPGLDISARRFVNQEQSAGQEKLECDVVFTGKYSYSVTGSLQFDFVDDKTGAVKAGKGDNCDTDSKVVFENKLPAHSPYKKDPAVSVKSVGEKELHLDFPGSAKCQGEVITTVFLRNK